MPDAITVFLSLFHLPKPALALCVSEAVTE